MKRNLFLVILARLYYTGIVIFLTLRIGDLAQIPLLVIPAIIFVVFAILAFIAEHTIAGEPVR